MIITSVHFLQKIMTFFIKKNNIQTIYYHNLYMHSILQSNLDSNYFLKFLKKYQTSD